MEACWVASRELPVALDRLEFAQIICGDEINKSPDDWIWTAGIVSRWMEACWVASRELPVALNKLEFARLVGGDEILAKSPDG